MSFNLNDFNVLGDNSVQPTERVQPLTGELYRIPPMKKSRLEKGIDWVCNPKTLSGVTAFSSVLACLMIFALSISCTIIYTDVSKLMVDGKDTLTDLNIVLPEISKTMTMLQNLCNTPSFKHYCFPEE